MRVGKEARIPVEEIDRLLGLERVRYVVLYGRVSGAGQQKD